MHIKYDYYEIDLQYLPTRGLFYPDHTMVFFRAASIYLVRHLSTMDEDDITSTNEFLNDILKKVCKVTVDNQQVDICMLNELDRMYILLASKELTFPEPNVRLSFDIPCKYCGSVYHIELIKNNLTMVDIEDSMMRFFDFDEKCFIIQNLKIYIPTVGTNALMQAYFDDNDEMDTNIADMLLYLIPDYKTTTFTDIKRLQFQIKNMDRQTFLLLIYFVDKLQEKFDPSISMLCGNCNVITDKKLNVHADKRLELNTLTNSIFHKTYGLFRSDNFIKEYLYNLELYYSNRNVMDINIFKSFQMNPEEINNFEYSLIRHLRLDYQVFYDDNVPFYWIWELFQQLKDEKDEEAKQNEKQEQQQSVNPSTMMNQATNAMKGVTSNIKMPSVSVPRF